MKFPVENLDEHVRQLMINEIDHDIINDQLHFSRKFNDTGKLMYPHLLKQAIVFGSEETLTHALKLYDCFEATVSETAHEAVAENAFNRFYIRAACVRAFENGEPFTVSQARPSDRSRPASETVIDKAAQLKALLECLRKNMAVEKAVDLSLKRTGELTAKAM